MAFITLGVIRSNQLGINVASGGASVPKTFNDQLIEGTSVTTATPAISGFANAAALVYRPLDGFAETVVVTQTAAQVRTLLTT